MHFVLCSRGRRFDEFPPVGLSRPNSVKILQSGQCPTATDCGRPGQSERPGIRLGFRESNQSVLGDALGIIRLSNVFTGIYIPI